MAYQALYRRYRPGRFSELVGQDHVVAALRNAVRDDRVGHAYLFSGPRGTGKTTSARILAKALNCQNLGDDGEPCGTCESCVAFAEGTSFDLHELDAASNNGVDAIRDLIGKVALGSPGRTKVYVLDEVHMLTSGAENALLKTLEEPPDHVVFVLATTEPHKVVPTIRSRTQHLEFDLIPADELAAHVRWVAQDAGIDVTDEMIDHAVRDGGGSARDTLSALDQAVAAGGVRPDDDAVDRIVDGLSNQDGDATLLAVTEAISGGRDPRVVGEAVLDRLRDAFLAAMGGGLGHLGQAGQERAQHVAEAMGAGAITRSLEALGSALVEMRQAPDPRIDLEVALMRLTRPDVSTDLASLVQRIERLERGAKPAAEAPAPEAPKRASMADRRRAREKAKPPEPKPQAAEPAAAAELPSRDEVTLAWGDKILPGLPNRPRSRFSGGRFLPSGPDGLVYALPNDIHRKRCEEVRGDVDAALAEHFGRPVPLRLVVDDGSVAAMRSEPAAPSEPEPVEELVDPSELRDAPADDKTPIDRLTETFPGARLVDVDDG